MPGSLFLYIILLETHEYLLERDAMVPVEEFSYKGTVFIVECKEHLGRVAGPGARNYIIRGLRSYGVEVELPETIEKDPVTSFMPSGSGADSASYPGVRKLFLPKHLGRFLERNDIFPDLEILEVDPDNRIFSTDGRMLYRDEGRELCLSLTAGNRHEGVTEAQREQVIVPEKVQRLGPFSFVGSNCEEIIFENPWIEAEESSFDKSVWLSSWGLAAYVGNMLYRINTEGCSGKCVLLLDKKTRRIHPQAFMGAPADVKLKLSVPSDMDFPGFTKELTRALRKSSGLITVSRAGAGGMEKEIPIPLSLDSTGLELLQRSLDDKEDHFDELFERIGDSKEKLVYALFASSFSDAELYPEYIKSNQKEALMRAVEVLDEKALSRLVKRKFFDREALIGMLPQLQSNGMVSSVAGILIALNGDH